MDEARRRRLRFRAWRRGFREADLILGPFADTHAGAMSETEIGQFELLLEESDADVYAWIVGREAVPAPFAGKLIAALRASAMAGLAARGG